MNGELQKSSWLDRNYRCLMLAFMSAELLLLLILVGLEVVLVLK